MNFKNEELKVLIEALDLYVRVGLGQFEEVSRVYQAGAMFYDEEIHKAMISAKQKAGHPENGSYGIHHPNVPEIFRTANKLKKSFQSIR